MKTGLCCKPTGGNQKKSQIAVSDRGTLNLVELINFMISTNRIYELTKMLRFFFLICAGVSSND